MKFIFNQRVLVTADFYMGQLGVCKNHTKAKEKPAGEEQPISSLEFSLYNVQLESSPDVAVWIKEENLQDASPVDLPGV